MRIRFCTVLFAASLLRASAGETASATEFTFAFHDGLIWVQVHARESAAPLNFLLDSGAGVSVINHPTAEKLGLKRGRRVTVQGVGSTATGYWPQHLSAAPNAVPLPKKFLSVDLSEHSRACECNVDGLLGADFFREHTVQINFAEKKIRLSPPNELSKSTGVFALQPGHDAMLLPLRVNGGNAQLMRLDTGCATALHWVTSGTPAKKHDRQPAIALAKLSVSMTETTVQLGDVRFEAVPTALHDRQIFSGESGLLGNGFLSRFKSVTIDAHAGRVALEQVSNSPFN